MGILQFYCKEGGTTMIKSAIVVCLAALAAADADADALYGSYGYSAYGPYNYGYSGYSVRPYSYGYASYRPAYSYGRYYGKRSADAEPEAEADAFYGYSAYPYNYGYNAYNTYSAYRPYSYGYAAPAYTSYAAPAYTSYASYRPAYSYGSSMEDTDTERDLLRLNPRLMLRLSMDMDTLPTLPPMATMPTTPTLPTDHTAMAMLPTDQ